MAQNPTSTFLSLYDIKYVPRELFAGLRDAVKQEQDDYESLGQGGRLMRALLDKNTIREFLGWYFSNINQSKLKAFDWNSLSIPEIPEDGDIKSTFAETSSFSQKGAAGIKQSGEHVLTKEQYENARRYLIEENPQMLRGAQLISDGMIAYIQAVRKTIPSFASINSDVNDRLYLEHALQRLEIGLGSNSIMEEFLPIVAYNAAQHAQGKQLKHNDFAAGINSLFGQRGALEAIKTTTGHDGSVNEHKTCPFKRAIGHVMNTTFERLHDGTYTVSDKAEHAGLLKFSMHFLEKHGVVSLGKANHPKPSR